MNRMQNRRHLYIEIPHSSTSFTKEIEIIDNYIEGAFNLDALASDIIIYINRNDKYFMVGREIIGTDTEIKHHESLKIKDYGSASFDKTSFEIDSLPRVLEFFSKNEMDLCRVVLKSNDLFHADVYSFFNLEK